MIFPRSTFDPAASSVLAASAVATFVYLGAVHSSERSTAENRWTRPSAVMWLNDDVLAHDTPANRDAWYAAASGPKAREAVETLQRDWGVSTQRRYADNTRETLRDETLPLWHTYGAAVRRADLPTTSPLPRWAVTRAFAGLFAPDVTGDELQRRMAYWRDHHASQAGRVRALAAQTTARAAAATDVEVRLPTGQRRSLEPGLASQILKGVVEQWAARKLRTPLVLTISEPGDKVYLADDRLLREIGVRLDVSNLLPDALIADAPSDSDAVHYWMIEAVATDGPVDERRKARLIEWAGQQGIEAEDCRFLTAFASRNAGPARRRLKDLASGTAAWFLDEPDSELRWAPITTEG